MKIAKIILFCLGILLILLNTVGFYDGYRRFHPPANRIDKVYFYIGLHLFHIFGIAFLVIAFVLHKKAKRAKLREDIDSIGKDLQP